MTDRIRIDRWLFFCRFYKTRVRASEAVGAGHVRLNGERATPGARVRTGDRIDLTRDRLPHSLRVLAIPARRGPAKEASTCFEDDEVVARERTKISAALRRDRLSMPLTAGRPDKRTRRKLRDRNRGD